MRPPYYGFDRKDVEAMEDEERDHWVDQLVRHREAWLESVTRE